MKTIKFKKFNKKSFKKLAAGFCIGATMVGATAILPPTIIENNVKSGDYLTDEYGSYNNIDNTSLMEELTLKNNDFTFLKITNDKFDQEELNKAQKENKEIGLIVEPTNYTYSSIYKTIDSVKEMVANYDITCPILYDISKYMSDDTIRANCLLAEEFCNKLSANGCYIGLYGSKEDMEKFKNKFIEVTGTHEIELYDKMIATNEDLSNNLENSNVEGNMIKLNNDVILWKYKLDDIIKENNLNKKENFINEYVYNVQEGDSLFSISQQYNIKMDDLIQYNNLDNDTIYPGDEIIIPNNYKNNYKGSVENFDDVNKNSEDTNEVQSGVLSRIRKGIDISEFQGDVDWNLISNQVDYVILRLCDTSLKDENGNIKLDSRFLSYMDECEKRNIPVGVYYYSNATTKEEAIQEAEFVGEQLKNYTLEYPVYIDVETEYLNSIMVNNPDYFEDIIDGALSTLKDQGYFTGLYANKTNMNNLYHLSEKYTLWLTSNETYDTEVSFDDFKNINYNLYFHPSETTDAYQYSEYGKIDGIEGSVDIDYCNASIEEKIANEGYDEAKVR